MNEILKKIKKLKKEHAGIMDDYRLGYFKALEDIANNIQSSQADITDTNVGKMEHGGCNVCKYKSLEETEYPCRECKRAFIDKWKAISDETVEGE